MRNCDGKNSRGFTILELMIGMAIFLIISGAVLGAMGRMQTSYRTAEMYTTMQQRLRATMELMAQEIGQAGLQASTIEGAATEGDAGTTMPYKITTAVTATGSQTVTMPPSGSAVFGAYVGQWLNVDGGVNQDPIQITAVTPSTNSITATFGATHAAGTPAYPMGVFPHGILSDHSNPSPTGGSLAMFGEINGSGNGLWAVEYRCPSAYPGSLTRTVWNLSSSSPTASNYNLIDNVTACYFCWPGVTATQNPNCPQGMATPDTVTIPSDACGSDSCTYSIVTQVGFTITVSENAWISGSTQNITVTKSYSNIQPRNLITADKIYNAAVLSATNAANGTTFLSYLNGELQPDPPNVANVPWW